MLWNDLDTDWLDPVTVEATGATPFCGSAPPLSAAHAIRVQWQQRVSLNCDANGAESGPLRSSIEGMRSRGATALDLVRELMGCNI